MRHTYKVFMKQALYESPDEADLEIAGDAGVRQFAAADKVQLMHHFFYVGNSQLLNHHKPNGTRRKREWMSLKIIRSA